MNRTTVLGGVALVAGALGFVFGTKVTAFDSQTLLATLVVVFVFVLQHRMQLRVFRSLEETQKQVLSLSGSHAAVQLAFLQQQHSHDDHMAATQGTQPNQDTRPRSPVQ